MEIANPKKVELIKKVSKVFSIFYHTKKQAEKIDIENTKEIVVFDPSLIGDMVMIIPFFQVLRDNFKNAKITFVCAKPGEIILKDTNLIDEFIICNGAKSFLSIKNIIKDFKHLKNVLKEVNKKEYDIAIEPRGDFRYIYFMHFMKAKRKISFNYSGGECFLTDVIDMPSNYKTSHITDDKLYLLEKMGLSRGKIEINPILPITEEMKQMKEEFIKKNKLEGYKIIGIHPGAREKIRRYEKFDEVLENINSKLEKVAFLVYEGVNEEKEVQKVLEGAKKCNAKVFHMKADLAGYLKNITYSDTIICNDSSAGHIANGYKIPTIVIYGPVNPEGIRPYNNTTAVLNCVSIPLPCKPCYSAGVCPNGDYKCFNKINVEDIANLVIESINGENKKCQK